MNIIKTNLGYVPKPLSTIHMSSIKELNEKMGEKWFDKSSVRFFKSRISHHAIVSASGRYAVFRSSEKNPSGYRRYSIRFANLETGVVKTVGEFLAIATRREAIKLQKEVVMEI